MIKIHDVEQGTQEWLDARKGILTASEMKLVLTATLKKSNNEKTRAHVYKVISERLYDYKEENFQTFAMIRGHVEEEFAVQKYSENIAPVERCGFMTNDSLGFPLGFSPDGLVGDDGIIEIKSRAHHHQVKTVLEPEDVPKEYMLQIQTGLFVSGRKWCDFISYSNGYPMYVKRVYPLPEYQDAIKDAAESFEEKVKEGVEKFKTLTKDMIKTDFIEHDFEEITA